MQTGIIFDIKRYAIHDGPGIRTTVFLKGCPLECPWCHNPEGIDKDPRVVYRKNICIVCRACIEACPGQALSLTPDGVHTDSARCRHCGACVDACPSGARERVGTIETVQSLFDIIKKDVAFYETSGGGVTFSGGEPLVQADFLLEILQICGREDIHRALDTTGYTDTDTLMRVARHTDLFLFDLKFMDAAKHRHYTGVSNEQILKNLEKLAHHGSRIIIRIPLIPGINDDKDNIENTATFLQHLPQLEMVHILPYHDFQKNKYAKFSMKYNAGDIEPPSSGRIEEIKARLTDIGLRVAVGG
ncbi:MAG: glycyl-radical enzyme activating protein [Deltaproteobacteria bacterium]|nr:glycyl-radical enzyme activating protein [Deltaproteobacteria bacterium]